MKMEQVVEAISAAALPAEQQQKPINPREDTMAQRIDIARTVPACAGGATCC